jgi:hypothetical protein
VTAHAQLAAQIMDVTSDLASVGWHLERGLPAARIIVGVDSDHAIVRIVCAHPDDVDVWADEFQTHALLRPVDDVYSAALVEDEGGAVRLVADCAIDTYSAVRGPQ